MTVDNIYRGWRRPGPLPPGGVDVEPGESLDVISGSYRIFQYERGHRYSTDDVLTAWYGSTYAPRVARAADLGSGIGSVALICAWRLPGATFCTVEAQDISIRLARKTIRYNGLESRFTLYHGDLRDPSILANEEPFDLVTGSPPYFPSGTATEPGHPQAVPARMEVRGGVEDYARAAARILAPGGLFAFVFPVVQDARALNAIDDAGLTLIRRRDIIFKDGEPPLIAVFAASRREDIPVQYHPLIEPPLTIRHRDRSTDPEYSAIRLSFGFPPGNVPP
ncbi:MAG: SAM-dependent methyltransferase [Acidobacteria bacterium]|nr:MAG: SAM-dependent methyltransferase [Acidobacteriota bacterium]